MPARQVRPGQGAQPTDTSTTLAAPGKLTITTSSLLAGAPATEPIEYSIGGYVQYARQAWRGEDRARQELTCRCRMWRACTTTGSAARTTSRQTGKQPGGRWSLS